MNTAYLALGSNLDTPEEQVCLAAKIIGRHPQIGLIAMSSLYQSSPLGNVPQPDYINAVVKIQTPLSPAQLLKACQAIEQEMGRVRTTHWAARIIDIDIIDIEDVQSGDKDLTLPHPEYKARAFVILPLGEITSGHIFADGERLESLQKTHAEAELFKLSYECDDA